MSDAPNTILQLPFPLSVNNLFANVPGRGRVPTKEYKAWKKLAAQTIQAQRPRKIAGRCEVTVTVVAPDSRERDADNCNKAVLDALVKAGVIERDSNRCVKRVIAEWEDEGEPCTVTIRSLS